MIEGSFANGTCSSNHDKTANRLAIFIFDKFEHSGNNFLWYNDYQEDIDNR